MKYKLDSKKYRKSFVEKYIQDFAVSWHQLAPAGTSWHQLAPACVRQCSMVWYGRKEEPAPVGQHQLASTSWHQLALVVNCVLQWFGRVGIELLGQLSIAWGVIEFGLLPLHKGALHILLCEFCL